MADEIFGLTRREYDAFVDMKRDWDGGKLSNKPERRRKTTPRPRISNNSLRNTAGLKIAEVDSKADGGGYYNCHLQSLDADDWDSDTTDQIDDIGDSVVVLNLGEIGRNQNNGRVLNAGDLIECWNFTDDEGNVRLVGDYVRDFDHYGVIRLCKAREAAQTDGRLLVKLLSHNNFLVGNNINIFVFRSKAATDYTTDYWLADTGAPIANNDPLMVTRHMDNEWYLVSALVKRTACT